MRAPALLILGKDLRLRLRDRSVLLFAFVVPLGLTLLFAQMFPDDDALEFSAAVIDEDGSDVSAGFVDGVVPSLVDEGLVELADPADRATAEAAVREGDLDVLWVVPPGFGDALTAGAGGRLEVLATGDATLARTVAVGIAEGYASRLEAASLAVATTAQVAGERGDDALLAEVARQVATTEPGAALVDLPARDRQLDAASHLAAGMAAFFVFFTVQFGVLGLLEERQLATLPRLLASPLTPGSIRTGKLLGAGLLGVVSMTVLAITSHLALGARWGPPVGVAVLIVAIVVAALGIMSLVGVFAHTAEQAGNLQGIVAVVLGMSGGVFFPVPMDTGVLRLLSLASPHAWFLGGLGDVHGQGSWTAALPAAAALLAFGAVTTLIAVALTRWRGGERV